MTLFQLIRSDCRRYRATGAKSTLGVVLLTQGLWATTVYRIHRHVILNWRIPVIRPLARICGLLANKLIEITTGICLPPEVDAGEGLYIGHFGLVILSPEARLGSNCNLSQSVTIGVGGRGEARGAPRLGNRVYVGPGAILFGRIEIGDDVAIGAGAVVTKSIPARSVVAGNPARVISEEGSFEFVSYDGMDEDPERRESMALRSPPPA